VCILPEPMLRDFNSFPSEPVLTFFFNVDANNICLAFLLCVKSYFPTAMELFPNAKLCHTLKHLPVEIILLVSLQHSKFPILFLSPNTVSTKKPMCK
jgi:hypothetical protein